MNSRNEIDAVLNDYMQGLFTGDVERLRGAFHVQANLFGDVRGAPYQNSLDGWLQALSQRTSPADLGEEFRMEILDVQIINDIAFAKLNSPMLGFNYFDYLALVRQGERWLITNKLFTHVGA